MIQENHSINQINYKKKHITNKKYIKKKKKPSHDKQFHGSNG